MEKLAYAELKSFPGLAHGDSQLGDALLLLRDVPHVGDSLLCLVPE